MKENKALFFAILAWLYLTITVFISLQFITCWENCMDHTKPLLMIIIADADLYYITLPALGFAITALLYTKKTKGKKMVLARILAGLFIVYIAWVHYTFIKTELAFRAEIASWKKSGIPPTENREN